ncbi:hypothetical protein Neosp_001353 [[Neocosmospora] mangrovei]
MPSRAHLALILFLPCSVQAVFGSTNETDFWAEFGNNFATDLAPIISLFGEQVTKQFLSESTTILDTIIFAVGPLGIITAIVSCIRVSGNSFLKSIIGRAREPHAVPEVELCSSTSESVCELWSDGGICRVFGRPKIFEFIFREPEEDEVYNGYDIYGGEGKTATYESTEEFPPFPNLALNIGVQEAKKSIFTLWLAAVFGLLLQSSFVWYTIWATWYSPTFYEGGQASHTPIFFTFTIAGTISIILGMALCAALIDRKSKEQRLVLPPLKKNRGDHRPKHRIFWLQPGGQRIGDQEFDAFACNEVKTEYIASLNNRGAPAPIFLVWLGVGLSFVGWVVQFIGLRGQHATISLYQLCCTMVMSIIRASIRSSRSTPTNQLENASEETRGHELDWQAFQLINGSFSQGDHGPSCSAKEPFSDQGDPTSPVDDQAGVALQGKFYWTVHSSLPENIPTREVLEPPIKPLVRMKIGENVAVALSWGSRVHLPILVRWIESHHSDFFAIARNKNSTPREILKKPQSTGDKFGASNVVAKSMRIRMRLAHLTKQLPYQAWEIDTRETALHLKSALEKSSQLLYSDQMGSLVWSTGCRLMGTEQCQSREMHICFHMNNFDSGWHIDENQLEAVLGLWSWSVDRYVSGLGLNPEHWFEMRQSKRVIVRKGDTKAISFILKQWGLLEDVDDKRNTVTDAGLTNLSVPHMILTDPKNEHAATPGPHRLLSYGATSSLLQMMAQDLFTSFVETIGTLRFRGLKNATVSKVSGSGTEGTTEIEGMVQCLVSEGLATRDEAIMTVVPALCPRSESSNSAETVNLLFSQAVLLKRREDFGKSLEVVKTLAMLGSPKTKARADAFLYGIHRSELRWMMQQHSFFTKRECMKRRCEMVMGMGVFDYQTFDDVRRLQRAYISVIDWLLWSNRVSPTLVIEDLYTSFCCQITGSSVLRHTQPTFEAPTALDKETLDDLNLDGIESRRDSFETALILDQRFNLGESSVAVRKQLLRWAVESDCTGLVEDLWLVERKTPLAASVFSGGSDELFWAASLRTDSHDMINTMRFLLEVVETDQFAKFQGKEEMDQSWWETSRNRDLIKAKYEQVSSVLAAASANPDGQDVIELLTWYGDRTRGLRTHGYLTRN